MRQLDAMNDAAKNEGGAAGIFMGANTGNMLSSGLGEALPGSTAARGIAERLSQLKALFSAELITEEEYARKKEEILKEL